MGNLQVTRVVLAAVADIADRLEGKPMQKVDVPVYPQAIFYRAGDPPPPGVIPPQPA
jgi:hypothetical protein